MNVFKKVISWYFNKESLPYWCILLVDCIIIFLSGVFSYWLFRKTMVLIDNRFGVIYTLLLYVFLGMIGAKLFRTYSGIVRFSSFDDLLKVAYANGLAMLLALIASFLFGRIGIPELSALSVTETLLMFVMSTMGMWAIRIVVKALYDVSFSDTRSTRVLIYGAMSGGVGIAKNIRSQRPLKFRLQGFISHDKRAKHIMLMGKPVYNVDDNLAEVIKQKRIQAVLVSPLRIDEFRNNQRVQDILISAGCKIFMAQQVKEAKIEGGQLTEDDFQSMQMKEVSVEDLLPRSEIKVDMKSVGELLKGRRILITGSAGSIGSEMVRQIARFKPEKMMLIDQAETPEHDIRLMMARDYPDVDATTVVTTICNKERMDKIFGEFRPDYVFHAAAYKHVPMMEDNPSEAVLNNIYGTKVVADLSVKYGVKKFVMVSTDKAVNPTNVMGCSKRICEIYVQSLNRKLQIESQSKLQADGHYANQTQFVTTRFGNVLGSNGSVIPLFKEQIRKGGPVTVTDERIVRFFMLIPEACKLVLEAGTKGNGGEIFVFDMGKPVKIADLAKRMIALSGAKNVEIKFTGLRDGEKLYEEVLNDMEGTKPTFHEKIRIAQVREYEYGEVSKAIDELIAISKNFDNMETVRKMKQIVPEYKSNNSVYEQLDKPHADAPSA
ncbi:MAG: polysaccharide biosynthesis protein [Prevotella sp.]|nr:polysaccharide biosynthesis protein [Prevotella sp.]